MGHVLRPRCPIHPGKLCIVVRPRRGKSYCQKVADRRCMMTPATPNQETDHAE